MEFCAHTVKGLQRITSQIHTKFVGVSLSGLECFFLCSFLRRRRPTELHSTTLAFHHKEVSHFDEIVLLGSEDGHLCSCNCIMVWTELHCPWILLQEILPGALCKKLPLACAQGRMGNVQALVLLQLPPSIPLLPSLKGTAGAA